MLRGDRVPPKNGRSRAPKHEHFRVNQPSALFVQIIRCQTTRMKRQAALLDQGFYTMREAVGLIGLDVPEVTSSKLRPLFGSTETYPPAILSSRAYDGRVRDISFYDLIELRFVAHFRRQGVTQQAIRMIGRRARELSASVLLRGRIFSRAPTGAASTPLSRMNRDRLLLELSNSQYELDVIEETLRQGMDWDANKFAISWRPC